MIAKRAVSLAAVAGLAVTGGLAGCGSSQAKPSQQALAAKLRGNSELQSFSASQIDCVAAVVHQYGNAKTLNQYVEGKIPANDLDGSSKGVVFQRLQACLKSPAG